MARPSRKTKFGRKECLRLMTEYMQALAREKQEKLQRKAGKGVTIPLGEVEVTADGHYEDRKKRKYLRFRCRIGTGSSVSYKLDLNTGDISLFEPN